ncbi:hypothetical protein H2200_006602 [Cladophialophora chaetospira]|uniref:Uncharacterized protein n=1 Tax=Cladophialophora chaetospira TaxID=386627 RepID=A0AA39CI32_9EURO|nr:hypothetical protein H2200_006602 [Cladophialophora chaetospira]
MASTYTKARLQYALKVFREAREDTKPAAPKIQRHLRNDYQLRRVKTASTLLHATTWDDDDASSDEYNPSFPTRRRPVIPKTPKAKRPKQGLVPANPSHTTLEKSDADSGPFPSLVTLKLCSHRGRVLLNALAGQHGTGYDTKDSDEDSESLEGSGRTRRRETRKTFMEKQDEESNKIDEGTTRSGLRRKVDTPVKTQGCKVWKQANTHCPAKPSDKLPCKRCEDDHINDVEYEILLDANARSKDAFALRPAPSHAQPTRTSLVTGERPIDELRRHFVDVQAMRGGHALLPGISRQNPITLDSPSPTPETPKPKPDDTFIIRTPWAHPIEFKSKAAECHFCQDFRYGIYGYGLLKVEVARMADGQLLEVANGHLSKGKAATRMCILCALKRLYISRCKVHAIRQTGSPEKARISKYMQQLLDKQYPDGPAIKTGVYYPCSLCAQPAFWRCVADQSHDLRRCKINGEQGKGIGCGLLLCKSCAEQLQADGGVLTKTTVQKDSGNNCRRADMGFLFAGSLLHRAYN